MKTISLLIIAISFSTWSHAQTLLTKDQREVQQTVISMVEALSNRDTVNLKEYCTADVTFYEYGQVWTIDTLINKAIKLNKATDFKRTNTFNFINTTTDRTTAWLTYHLNSAITRDGKQSTVQWLETVVLTKHKKRWKVKHVHSTRVKRI